jgi:hypothetical protein
MRPPRRYSPRTLYFTNSPRQQVKKCRIRCDNLMVVWTNTVEPRSLSELYFLQGPACCCFELSLCLPPRNHGFALTPITLPTPIARDGCLLPGGAVSTASGLYAIISLFPPFVGIPGQFRGQGRAEEGPCGFSRAPGRAFGIPRIGCLGYQNGILRPSAVRLLPVSAPPCPRPSTSTVSSAP